MLHNATSLKSRTYIVKFLISSRGQLPFHHGAYQPHIQYTACLSYISHCNFRPQPWHENPVVCVNCPCSIRHSPDSQSIGSPSKRAHVLTSRLTMCAAQVLLECTGQKRNAGIIWTTSLNVLGVSKRYVTSCRRYFMIYGFRNTCSMKQCMSSKPITNCWDAPLGWLWLHTFLAYTIVSDMCMQTTNVILEQELQPVLNSK